MRESLYLAQTYQDAWEDFQRSLHSPSFPVWDYVILTASNEHQARAFRAQLERRKGKLPARTRFAVIPDEGNVRVGSGGSTLTVLKYLKEQDGGWEGKRTLVIHSGGDSRRLPQYSALGKLFSPVPHALPDGRSSTLFDEILAAVSAMPGRIREGMLLLSGDVLLLLNPLLIDDFGRGAAVISFKEDAQTGKNHGVYLRGEDGNVKAFLHKQSVDTLRQHGAVNGRGQVDIDTGAMILGPDVMEALYGLIAPGGVFSRERYAAFVNDRVRLSLYGDFQYPMAANSTLEEFYREKPEGEDSPELRACRAALWHALRPFRLKLLRLAPAKFIHVGTTREMLALMTEDVERYRDLGWEPRVDCAMDREAGVHSVLSPGAEIGHGCYLESSLVHGGAKVGDGCILSYVEVHAEESIPPHTVLQGLRQINGQFVCRIFATGDNPKENKLIGKELKGDLWRHGDAHTLWNAQLYPACETIREAVGWALKLYAAVQTGDWKQIESWPGRKSLCAGFRDADPLALLAWDQRMTEWVQMHRIAGMIHRKTPAGEAHLSAPLTPLQREWLLEEAGRADPGTRMRLHYYVGQALGGAEGDREIGQAFRCLSQTIWTNAQAHLTETPVRIAKETHGVALPLRVNWGGGWSDTPPYCNENGGTVLNAAILLNGERPVRVNLQRLPEKKIILESRDLGDYGEFTSLAPLRDVGDPFDPFVLQKAALLVCGVLPAQGGDLAQILTRLGGGFRMNTEVVGAPKGSGLGTSSILAAACVKGLFGFLGLPCAEDAVYRRVLCMEQMMSTGGGWQDQAGGLTDGIKFIRSRPGWDQKLTVELLRLDAETAAELQARFVLIYTGQRRLARHLLRRVVGRYLGNDPDTVHALNEIQRKAALMRFELERGRVDAFASLLTEHWEWSKKIDAGCSNTLIEQIFDAADDLLAGKMVCGAGGGGFLQGILRRGVSREQLQKRLKEVFSDTDINVWDARLV